MENNEGKKIADSRVGIGNELSVALNNIGLSATKAKGYRGTLEGTDNYGLTMKTVVNMKPVSVYVEYVHIAAIYNKDDIDSIKRPNEISGRSRIDDGFKLPYDDLIVISTPPIEGLIDDIESEH